MKDVGGGGRGLALYPTSHRGKSNRGVRGSDLHFRKNPSAPLEKAA